MKKEQIADLLQRFEEARHDIEGVECWSARDLQKIFRYKEWRNFTNAIQKASKACEGSGVRVENHFVGISKMVTLGSGAEREIKDVALTRYACYLVAQNGDSSKSEIAFAQTYFAVQTRRQELIEKRLLDIVRLEARAKLTESEKALSEVIFERGVNDRSFAIIRSKGDAALFGGRTTKEMKDKLGVPSNRPLADFLSNVLIRGKAFATEITAYNTIEQDLQGDESITKEHVINNTKVREMLLERNIVPENLAAGEDTKKLKKKVERTEKELLKNAKKKKS